MHLHLLNQTTCLAIYYDSGNDWLFLDWHGDLTLPDTQAACLALAQCCLARPYPRVLNSNAQIERMSWSVVAWLVTDFLPHLSLAGVEHVAWIYSANLTSRHVVQTIVDLVPGFILNTFVDIEEAVNWLQHTRLAHQQGCYIHPKRSAAEQAKLVQVVQKLSQCAAHPALPAGRSVK
jgi:hypothetical protein